MAPTVTGDCESIRGEWSEPGQPPNACPDCGAPMPYRPGPLRSWMADRDHDASRVHPGNLPLRIKRGRPMRWAA